MKCENCAKTFTRRDILKRHQESSYAAKRHRIQNEAGSSSDVWCEMCNLHIPNDGVEKIGSAFGNKIVSYNKTIDDLVKDRKSNKRLENLINAFKEEV
ncbi:hypothetical protein FQR65_LT03080 [Abscondita terminalis]|nr:hypothetical protein FQR65_LT03080 [Abscondita terminalis]